VRHERGDDRLNGVRYDLERIWVVFAQQTAAHECEDRHDHVHDLVLQQKEKRQIVVTSLNQAYFCKSQVCTFSLWRGKRSGRTDDTFTSVDNNVRFVGVGNNRFNEKMLRKAGLSNWGARLYFPVMRYLLERSARTPPEEERLVDGAECFRTSGCSSPQAPTIKTEGADALLDSFGVII